MVRRLRPGAVEAGDIIHIDGTVLGRHNGIIDYTIGQRRGLGIGGRKDVNETEGPLYVVSIDPETHQVIVGPQTALACEQVKLGETSWVARDGAPLRGCAVLARLRNTAPAMPAIIESIDDQGAVIRLHEPQFGIAAGQVAAIYDADDSQHLLGGGWITAAPLAALTV